MPPCEVILDVDTGVDDALALLLALRHPSLRVRAITCVDGNTSVEQVVQNTLKVLEAAGAPHIPVAQGAAHPILEPTRYAHYVHGRDGLADLDLPAPARKPVAMHAVELLRSELLASPGPVTLIALAPLTNLALLIRTFPEVLARIERIVFMGGSAGVGNVTPVAEFNIWHDPEAAAVVLSSGVRLTMYGLDVFYDVAITRSEAQHLQAGSDRGASLAGRLLLHLIGTYTHEARIPLRAAATIGDAGAVCAVADPTGLTCRRMPVSVSLASGPTRGQTVVDQRTHVVPSDSELGVPYAPVDVALAVERERYRRLFLETVKRVD